LIRKVAKPDLGGKESIVVFLGDSLDVISGFPIGVKRNLGHAIRCVQEGLDPPDSKPLTVVGAGVYELRDADEAGWYRVIYLKKIKQTVYILHCFSKKARKTPRNEIKAAQSRLKALNQELIKEHGHHENKRTQGR
jgi:phage-related protein